MIYDALVVQRPGLRTRNAATWVRVPPGALCFLDNSASEDGAHDVAVAYRLAMAEVRVRLPLGTSWTATGVWEKPENQTVRERESTGSTPATLTSGFIRFGRCRKSWFNARLLREQNRRFESCHPSSIAIPMEGQAKW